MIQTANGLVLDLSQGEQGGKLVVFTKHGGDNQLWRIEDGKLISKSGFAADIKEGSKDIGASVIGWEMHDRENQKWKIKGNCIHSKQTDMVMDLKEGKMEEGTEVIMFPRHGGPNQMWFIYPA